MEETMQIEGCTALVTGANRGLGQVFTEALISAGAAKVYAAARDPATIHDSRVVPVKLDITSAEDVAAAAAICADVNVLINNAGAMLATPLLVEATEAALRLEMEVNVFGLLRMAQTFAPILAGNGGGVMANMLSVVSWYVYPFNPTYCASKFAAQAITDALRIQLKAQGTQVVGIYAGFIDTDMALNVSGEKTPPRQVAERTLAGIRNQQNHVHADQAAENLWAMTRNQPEQLEAWAQQLWDEGRAWVV
jgi:NAD(P)-dependent dehydrogenase (short-subunit alcohol dehydrogenase family)